MGELLSHLFFLFLPDYQEKQATSACGRAANPLETRVNF
jgi:hypothetical protein